MPVVTVEMWAGRTIEQKKQLVEGITLVMTNLGIPPQQFISSSRITLSTTGQLVGNLLRKNLQKHNAGYWLSWLEGMGLISTP